jgi:hypothetical protein
MNDKQKDNLKVSATIGGVHGALLGGTVGAFKSEGAKSERALNARIRHAHFQAKTHSLQGDYDLANKARRAASTMERTKGIFSKSIAQSKLKGALKYGAPAAVGLAAYNALSQQINNGKK